MGGTTRPEIDQHGLRTTSGEHLGFEITVGHRQNIVISHVLCLNGLPAGCRFALS
jgi:hypothetical protein